MICAAANVQCRAPDLCELQGCPYTRHGMPKPDPAAAEPPRPSLTGRMLAALAKQKTASPFAVGGAAAPTPAKQRSPRIDPGGLDLPAAPEPAAEASAAPGDQPGAAIVLPEPSPSPMDLESLPMPSDAIMPPAPSSVGPTDRPPSATGFRTVPMLGGWLVLDGGNQPIGVASNVDVLVSVISKFVRDAIAAAPAG